MCVHFKPDGTLGASFVRSTSNTFYLAEFKDSTHFANLESLIVQTNTKEILIHQDDIKPKLDEIFARHQIMVTNKNVKKFKDSLPKLSKPVITHYLFAQQTLGAICDFLQTSEPIQLHEYNLEEYMKVDQTVIESFGLLPKAHQNSTTLFSLLNQTRTKMGSRKLEEWIRRPLRSQQEIEKRWTIVETYLTENDLNRNLDKILSKIPDISTLNRRIGRKRAALKDVVIIYDVVKNIHNIADLISSHTSLTDYSQVINFIDKELKPLQEMVEKMVDLNQVKNHKYMISASYNEELAMKSEKLKKVAKSIDIAKEEAELDLDLSIDIKQDDIVGLHFRVPKSKFDDISDDYEILTNNKQGIKFVNDKLKTLGEKQTRILEEYESLQGDIIKELIVSVGVYLALLDDAAELIACLDVLLAFAKATSQASIQWIKPEIVSQGISIKSSRHPILEAQNTNVIPNDFEINKKRFCVLSGANMGGKSTYMRQIGIICILSQMGCFVPCESAQISIKDAIYSRVGAIDYLQRGLSTFMVEMIETNQILQNATNDSLIIIDELGRGTSSFDGYGLAFAISEHIITKIGAQCIFATHFHELSKLSEKYPDLVFNLQVKYLKSKNKENEDEIIMLHKVAPGVCDESFGIHVAELAKFPMSVIKLAKKRALELTQPSTKKSKPDETDKFENFADFTRIDLNDEEVLEKWIQSIKNQ